MSLRARWVGWRNRRLMSPAFQARAAAFPLTRWQARREAAGLFDLVAGFVYAQTLAAVVALKLCERLAEAPLPADALASACDLSPQAMERLLRAAAALGLVERLDGAWALGPRGAALLGNPGVAAMITHHRTLYADLADPVALLRRGAGTLADYWAYARDAAPDDIAPYSALMAASQAPVAAEVIAAAGLHRYRRLLDIGGGEGSFVRAVAAAVPGLELALFDLPAVAVRARGALDTAGLHRVAANGGSFLDDALPQGFDLMTLIRILHDHDDGPALTLLRNIRVALPPGGTLLIAEPMAPGRVGDAYFGFYLLAMGSGRARTPAEIAAMLREAGFTASRRLPTRMPLIASVMTANV